MKKLPSIVISICIVISIMLGVSMFMVGTESNVDGILSSFRNTSNNIRRPISVSEIKVQVGKGTAEETESSGNTSKPPKYDTQISGTWSEQLSALYNDTSRADRTHYQDGVYFAIRNIQGKQYCWEAQSKGAYPSAIQSGGSTVDGAGCYFFALAAYATNKSGKIVTVADILRNVGCNVQFKNGQYIYDKHSKYSLTGANTVNSIFADMGLPYTRGDDLTDWNAVEKELDNGNYILYYADEKDVDKSERKLSGSGSHWLIIVGYDSNNYYFLCNAGRNPAQPKDWVKHHRAHTYLLH